MTAGFDVDVPVCAEHAAVVADVRNMHLSISAQNTLLRDIKRDSSHAASVAAQARSAAADASAAAVGARSAAERVEIAMLNLQESVVETRARCMVLCDHAAEILAKVRIAAGFERLDSIPPRSSEETTGQYAIRSVDLLQAQLAHREEDLEKLRQAMTAAEEREHEFRLESRRLAAKVAIATLGACSGIAAIVAAIAKLLGG